MKRIHILAAGAFVLALGAWNLCGAAAARVAQPIAQHEALLLLDTDNELARNELARESGQSIGLDLSSEEAPLDFDSDEFQMMLKQLQAHIEGLKANMPEEEQKAFSDMEAEMKLLGDKLNTLKAEAAEFAHKKAAHKAEVQALRQQLTQLEHDKAELATTVARLTDEAAASDELMQKQDELAHMDATIEETTQELESKRAEKRAVKSKLKSHEVEIADLEKQMDTQSEFDFGQLFKDMPDEEPSFDFDAESMPVDEISDTEGLSFDYADESALADDTHANFSSYGDGLSSSTDASENTDAFALEESSEAALGAAALDEAALDEEVLAEKASGAEIETAEHDEQHPEV
jgi:predicted nuclease with TOPRIM domain